MSVESSSAAAWSTRLEPVARPEFVVSRPDDPRLGETVEFWQGDAAALTPGRPVLIGFPQDEGVRRNHGRPGAAEAPAEIRRWLYRLTPDDPRRERTSVSLLDLGNACVSGTLEESQEALAEVVAAVLQAGAVPILLGGGHETAYGHYLGYLAARRPVKIVNIDAHLDVRPLENGRGHSGSPFFQAMEHCETPLPGSHYVCIGAQGHAVARQHLQYVQQRGCKVYWRDHMESCNTLFCSELARLAVGRGSVYLSIDADAVCAADVPGVSAPNLLGLAGREVVALARLAGQSPQITSVDIVEINPRLDRDGQSARWAALAVWHFLQGLKARHQVS